MILKEDFESTQENPHEEKMDKKIQLNNLLINRRDLYDLAKSKHQDNPAGVEVGKPYDLNPSSYEDTNKILREECRNSGISKYGTGNRSWLAFVCDGSPFKLFISLFKVLFFSTRCKTLCGELKKHIDEVHKGDKESIKIEFDHLLPLCGPGHVEKKLLSACKTVMWDLIGFEKIASVRNFKSLAQHTFL